MKPLTRLEYYVALRNAIESSQIGTGDFEAVLAEKAIYEALFGTEELNHALWKILWPNNPSGVAPAP